MDGRPTDAARQAADWLIQLRSPDRAPDCEPAFADWLRASPEHIREYLRAVEVWEGLASADLSRERSRENLLQEAQQANLVELPLAAAVNMSPAPRRMFHWRPVGFAVFLTALLAAIVYLGWQRTAALVVSTGLGEQRSAVLPDHSLVELNTQSEVRIAFTATERRVELLHGEAFFDVTQDPTRPFIVTTDFATARAIGTQFSVYQTQNGTIVTVAAGRVLVLDKHDAARARSAAAVEVIPGTQVEARPGQPVLMRQADVERSFAWRERRLVFHGDTLETVVEEFNRYNSPPLVLTDPHLRTQRISGVFGANDPESLLDFLAKVDHVSITRDTSRILIGGDASQTF